MERAEIRPPAVPKPPELMVTKSVERDEVRDPYPCTKYHCDSIRVFAPPRVGA